MLPSVSAQNPTLAGASARLPKIGPPTAAALLVDMKGWPELMQCKNYWEAAITPQAGVCIASCTIFWRGQMAGTRQPELGVEIGRKRRLFPHQGNGDPAVR